jgi:CubicO group peptidase (beta-lactamase class C family)
VFATACSAQIDVAKRIDTYVRAEMGREHIPGLSLAVIKNGRIQVRKNYGFANLEHKVPIGPSTVFQSGSIGKQFTAAAIVLLVQDGKLSLDDRLSKFLPDTPAAWQNITIRHLLTGTSGMGSFGDEVDLHADYSEEQFFDFAKKAPLSFAPGSDWNYSNTAFVTLGILIHKLTGKFYGDFLSERIFRPLNMRTARIISEADIVPNRAAGYRLVDGELKNQEWVSPSNNSTADGSLYWTMDDLVKWDAALYTDFPLKQSTLREVFSPVKLSDGTQHPYGFGWHVENVAGRRFVYHGGAWQGFKSFIGRFPDDKLTIIFFANLWDTRDFKLAGDLAAFFYPQLKRRSLAAIEDTDAKSTRLIRRTLLEISRSKARPESFSVAGRADIFPEKIKQVERTLRSLSIPIAVIFSSELLDRSENSGMRKYRFLLSDVTKSFICTATLNASDEIAELDLKPHK